MKFLDRLIDKRVQKLVHEIPRHSYRIERHDIFRVIYEFAAKNEIDGPYLEFGTFEGRSFIFAYQAITHFLEVAKKNKWNFSNSKMYAFDSFEGLPQLDQQDNMDNYKVFEAGQYGVTESQFRENIQKGGVDLQHVSTVAGFYNESLNSDAAALVGDQKASVIHIDCDLYSSAKDVLHFIRPFLQDGTVLIFDDYYCYKGNPEFGVRKALEEWASEFRIKYSPYYQYSWAGQTFIVHQ